MGESDNLEDVGYLQDIISYIFDEKKIVTYKWISNVLQIHVNRAKQLLYTFIKHISEERLRELKVTYLVGGILPNDRGCRLQVVSEDDLEKVKAQFKVITSEHIYSVSLKNCLADLQNLCSVDGVKDSEVGRHGAVKCSKSISRTSQENASKRVGAYKIVEDDKKWPTAQTKQVKETSTGSNDKKSSKPSNGISAMFAAQNGKRKVEDNPSSKKSDVQKGESTEKSCPEKKAPAPKNASKGAKPPANRLAAMFSAQSAKPKTAKKDVQDENKSKSVKEDTEKDSKVPENSTKLDEKIEKNKTDSKNTQEKSLKTKAKSESKKSKPKKRKASNNQEKSKKRKRIVIMEDSDSSGDDIFGSEEEEEVEDKSYSQPPPENEEEEEIEDPTEVPASKDPDLEADSSGHHARKRHLVDKTFMDEEGYMVTKKVYEYVSCGESESEGEKENEKSSESKNKKMDTISKNIKMEIESKKIKTETPQISKTAQGPQKPQKNSNQKKNSPPEQKKQATLMNFFKRN